MTKKEILEVLYAERNRLMDLYTRPGWTTWAIVGAVASLVWMLLDVIYDQNLSLFHVITSFYCLFNLFVVIAFIIEAFKNEHQPLWGKGGAHSSMGLLYILLIYIFQFIIFIAYRCNFSPSYMYIIGIILNTLIILLMILAFILSFFPLLRTQKNNLWSGIILATPFLYFFVLFTIYLCQNATSIMLCEIKSGMIFFAISFLLGCFNISASEKLKHLDKLINETLYNSNPNEDVIISQLERCMIGLKYGDYLMNQYYEYISKRTKKLCDSLYTLHEVTKKSDECSKEIQLIINEAIDNIDHLRPIVVNVIKMIKLGYDETDLDPNLSPLLRVMKESLDLSDIWLDIKENASKYNIEDFSQFITLKTEEIKLIFKNR